MRFAFSIKEHVLGFSASFAAVDLDHRVFDQRSADHRIEGRCGGRAWDALLGQFFDVLAHLRLVPAGVTGIDHALIRKAQGHSPVLSFQRQFNDHGTPLIS